MLYRAGGGTGRRGGTAQLPMWRTARNGSPLSAAKPAGEPHSRPDHRCAGSRLKRSTRAGYDLGALRIFDPDYPEEPVVAAGAPWFMTLFGRDSLLTSWMALVLDPKLALATVRTLARLQGTKTDPATDEQPGRILHEVRLGGSRHRWRWPRATSTTARRTRPPCS